MPTTTRRLLQNTKLRFIGAGITNTAVDFIFFNIGVALLGLSPVFANVFSTSIAMAVSYLLNKKLVFRAEGKLLSKQLPNFLAVTIFTQWIVQSAVIAAGVVVIEGALRFAGYDNGHTAWLALNAAKAVAIVIGAVTNYVLYSRWVFSKSKQRPSL